ncbi:hypothetical protein GGS20DRAFT_296914 [Poronia punctata]|nr:hypothetical protein GGS20DRAFT_296914 [Poronia punctata]
MFGGSRRRRPSSNPLNSTTANPNAATAAASAFMSASNQNPNNALSSAAAAAALRARPHTPTNVAEVQTKRTVRRSASRSSSGSAPVAVGRPNGHAQLERRGSSASMADRTFRSPSPHGSSSASHGDQPPVPQIPSRHRDPQPDSRVTGTGMQNFRTASQKMGNATHSWYGQPAGDTSNVRRSDTVTRKVRSPAGASQSTMDSPPRPDSRNSVNFSYPSVYRPQSPPTSPTPPSSRAKSSPQLVYDPNSRRMVPKVHVEEAVEYRTKQAAEKPPRRRRDNGLQREGSRLAKGTVDRPKGTMVDESDTRHASIRPATPETKPSVTVPKNEVPTLHDKANIRGEIPAGRSLKVEEPGPPPTTLPAHHASPPMAHSKAPDQGTETSPSQIQSKQTSTGHKAEDGEAVATGNRVSAARTVLDALDNVPTRQSLSATPNAVDHTHKNDNETKTRNYSQGSPAYKPILPDIAGEQKPIVVENRPVVELAEEGVGIRRSSSNSPARQARFAPGLAEKLAVRHAPLPRSASPIKSAMKHTSSAQRENSPSDYASDLSASGAVSPHQREDSGVSRRKSVRVSFDDKGTVVVGESSPVVETDSRDPSPQTSKRWFGNIGRNKKKEIALDDDEIMKPRPALPSFGSIRNKAVREPPERPLVRPTDVTNSSAASSPELRPQSSSTMNDSDMLIEETEENPEGQSSDHALGSLISQEAESRVAANTSRFREPLPPTVTSVEGSGYYSDSLQSAEDEKPDEFAPVEASSAADDKSTMQSSQSGESGIQDKSEATEIPEKEEKDYRESASPHQAPPQISIIQPSPKIIEGTQSTGPSTPHYFDVPGGFPDYESDDGVAEADASGAAIFEPTNATIKPNQAASLPQTTLDTVTPVTDVDGAGGDDSDDSIYSDAYEDIPDIETGGFMSLDAIVENPTDQEAESRREDTSTTLSKPEPATGDKTLHSQPTENQAASQANAAPPSDADDWEQAKAFWRSLTAERRKQLELEAAEEAGVDGDQDEIMKVIHRRNSGRRPPEKAQPTRESRPSEGGESQQVKEKPRSRNHANQERAQQHQESPSASPKQSYLKKSLRDSPASKSSPSQEQTTMRKTMRDSNSNGSAPSPGSPRAKQHSAPPVSALKYSNKTRPQSAASSSSTTPAAPSQPTLRTRSALQRRGSDDSDSSFKRSRPASSGGGFTFRRTMRQTASQPHVESTKGSGRFSLRSLSPAGSSVSRNSNKTFTAGAPGGMTSRTLRSNSVASHQKNRSSIHFPLFGKSTTTSSSRDVKRHSRLDDSSDDDEVPRPRFSSRLDDSSDEEDTRPTSSRGFGSLEKGTLRSSATGPSLSRPAAVQEVDEESSDLPDSDDDMAPNPSQSRQNQTMGGGTASLADLGRPKLGAIGTSTLGRSRSGRGEIAPSVAAPALSPKEKRGGFMSILRRNKASDSASKIQRSELIDSAARRDTNLERDPQQLRDLRGDVSPSPRLHKRSFTSPSVSNGARRPTSAGNMFSRGAKPGADERPSLASRRSVSLGLAKGGEDHELENGSVVGSNMPKKKKFGALRRMFKLDE